MPGFRRMSPAPKIALTRFGAGVHSFWKAEKDLPVGIVPSVLRTWNDAVVGGYFVGKWSNSWMGEPLDVAQDSLRKIHPTFDSLMLLRVSTTLSFLIKLFLPR